MAPLLGRDLPPSRRRPSIPDGTGSARTGRNSI